MRRRQPSTVVISRSSRISISAEVHVLLELSRAGRKAPDIADPATAALASNMRQRLAAHEGLLGRHLEAMHELTSLITHAIKREDSDGTYSATAGARRPAGQAPRP